MTETVRLSLDWAPGAALVTFDRPETLNAVGAAMLDDLERALARLEENEESRVVVLTGAGRAFVGGGDIAHMAALSLHEGERFVYRGQALLRRIERLPKVTIAALATTASSTTVAPAEPRSPRPACRRSGRHTQRGRLRIIAAVQDPVVVRRILAHRSRSRFPRVSRPGPARAGGPVLARALRPLIDCAPPTGA